MRGELTPRLDLHCCYWDTVGSGALLGTQASGGRTAVGLVRVVLAVIVSVADEGRVGADPGGALELSWAALEFSWGRERGGGDASRRMNPGISIALGDAHRANLAAAGTLDCQHHEHRPLLHEPKEQPH